MSDSNITPFPTQERPKEITTTYHITYQDWNANNEPITVNVEGFGMVAGQFFAVQDERMIPLFIIPSDRVLAITTTIEESETETDDEPQQVH